jgi:predicted RNase H-like HicB family nuclease
MKAAGYILVTFSFHKEGNKWVGYCEELGTSTYGYSLPLVQTQLQEAIHCHINTLEDVGERERFFRENSIKFYKKKPEPCEIKISEPIKRDIFYQPHVQLVPV